MFSPTKTMDDILVTSTPPQKTELVTWGGEVEAFLSGVPEFTGLNLSANNPRFTLSDSNSDNIVEVVLDNTSLRLVVDGDNLVSGSQLKIDIDNVLVATFDEDGNFATTGEVEGGWLGSSLMDDVRAVTNVYRSPVVQLPDPQVSLVVAHGLGVKPDFVNVRLICKTDHSGFIAGEEYVMAGSWASNNGAGLLVDATNVTLITPSYGLSMVNTAGTNLSVTHANFNVQVIAGAFNV